jgi:formylmethanofuran dehydrogenase subunit D
VRRRAVATEQILRWETLLGVGAESLRADAAINVTPKQVRAMCSPDGNTVVVGTRAGDVVVADCSACA